ncbi:hypothetical protein [Oligoflexus tunisiensis]|uniref:hypothetical protein n=1 Tax=Oligoflexus tunisiensis TaxID=708132 RepID=UPI000B332AD7|nr:hypothetical protein [Oligoflexus tunisiensis]
MKYHSMLTYAAALLFATACGRASFKSVGPVPGTEYGGDDAAANPNPGPADGDASQPGSGGLPQVPGSQPPPGPIAVTNRAPILNCPEELTLGVGEWVRANLCRATDPDNDPLTFSMGPGSNCPAWRVSDLGFTDGRVGDTACQLVMTVSDGKLGASATIRIDGTAWNQTIGTDPTASRGFFNESDGALAIFNWQLNEPYALISLAFSDDKGELLGWDGRSAQLPRGKVIQNFANCHPLTRSANNGPLAMARIGNCGINLAAVLSQQVPAAKPWEKRYLRFAASNGATSGETWMSAVRTVANVPDGMTFIDAEEWPQEDFPANQFPFCSGEAEGLKRRSCRYDFAIDRYEVSAALSSTATVDPLNYDAVKSPLVRVDHQATINLADTYETTCEDYPCRVDLSSRVDTTRTVTQANGSKVEWVAAKQLCLNRSYDYEFAAWARLDDLKPDDRFTQKTPTPLRKFHLLLDSEFMVASWQTPDTSKFCQSEGRHLSGDPLWSSCRSYFGVHDLYGNRNEMTDDILSTETNRIYTRLSLYNTQDEYNQLVPLIGDGSDSIFYTNDWDLSAMLPAAVTTVPGTTTLGKGDTFIWNTQYPLPYAMTRGGGETFFYVGLNQREALGRYFVEAGLPLQLEGRGDGWMGDSGMRCALHPPRQLLGKRFVSFMTSSRHTANLGGLAGADAICNARARDAGYTQSFTALLSDANTDARSRILINGPVYSTRGQLIADNAAEFWDGSWKMSPYYDEKGDLVESVREIWTGSQRTGGTIGWKTNASSSANSWTSADLTVYPNVIFGKIFTDADGTRAWLDTRRFGDFTAAANSSKRLLCVSREAF